MAKLKTGEVVDKQLTQKVNKTSTLNKDINLDVCSACHPFYTGKQRNVDSGGRVDRFKKRFGAISKK